MKRMIMLAVGFTVALAQASYAQSTAVSGSSSTATASNSASSGAISGASNTNVFTSPSNTRATIENVPNVSAPSLGGGGHPCLAAVSGGLSGIGAGLSLGRSDAEVVCMLSFLGQNEAAIRALVMKNRTACEALNNVGYYLVPMGKGRSPKVVPFACDKKTVKGGVYTAGVASATVASKNAVAPATGTVPVARWQVCEMRDGAIYVKHRGGQSKEQKAINVVGCKQKLGY